MSLPVLIVGGGIAGLAVAYLLERQKIPWLMFECRERCDNCIEKQGFSITIHDKGRQVLENMELLEDLSYARIPLNGGYVRCDWTGRIVSKSPDVGCFTMPRSTIRETLQFLLDRKKCLWNHKMIKFEKKGDHIVGHFMTGNNKHTEVKGSCLLACDGIASPTRNSILEDSTNHLGIVSVYGLSYHKLTEELEIGDGHTRCIIKPYDTNRIMWQITFPYTDREIKNPEEVKKIAFFHMVGWAEPIPAIIRNSIKDTIYCSIVYDREPPKQPLEKGLLVTFLGDSAHAISSFESEGANMAMEDASKLVQIASEALRSGDNKRIDEAFRLYEKNMIERSTPVILASRQKTSEMHYRKEHFIHPEPFKWYSKSQGLPSPSMHKKNFVLWDGFDSFFGKWSKTVGFHDPVRKNWKLEDWKNQVDRWMYIEGPCKTSKE